MKDKKVMNRIIWLASILSFILSIILEFKIDKLLVNDWVMCLRGHRSFVINVLLGISASGVITGITTWVSFMETKANIEERINRYLCEVRNSFKEYCDTISQEDYKRLILYMKQFEDSMTDFINCVHSNDCKNNKYDKIEEIYCKKIIKYSTILIQYDCMYGSNTKGNEDLLFSDLSNGILIDTRKEFDLALRAVIGEYAICKNDFDDEGFLEQTIKIRERYSNEKDSVS